MGALEIEQWASWLVLADGAIALGFGGAAVRMFKEAMQIALGQEYREKDSWSKGQIPGNRLDMIAAAVRGFISVSDPEYDRAAIADVAQLLYYKREQVHDLALLEWLAWSMVDNAIQMVTESPELPLSPSPMPPDVDKHWDVGFDRRSRPDNCTWDDRYRHTVIVRYHTVRRLSQDRPESRSVAEARVSLAVRLLEMAGLVDYPYFDIFDEDPIPIAMVRAAEITAEYQGGSRRWYLLGKKGEYKAFRAKLQLAGGETVSDSFPTPALFPGYRTGAEGWRFFGSGDLEAAVQDVILGARLGMPGGF